MRRLIDCIKRWFGLGEDNEILADDDYDPAMIMHYMRPGATPNRRKRVS